MEVEMEDCINEGHCIVGVKGILELVGFDWRSE